MLEEAYESFVNDTISKFFKPFKTKEINSNKVKTFKDMTDEEFTRIAIQAAADEIIKGFAEFDNSQKQKVSVERLDYICNEMISITAKNTKYNSIHPEIECANIRGVFYGELLVSKNNKDIFHGAKTKSVGRIFSSQEPCFTRVMIKNYDEYGMFLIDNNIPHGFIINHVDDTIIPIYGELANIMVVCNKFDGSTKWFIANKLAETLENMHNGKSIQYFTIKMKNQ